MSYPNLRPSWIVPGVFALASALCVLFPRIDLYVSGLFFDGVGFPTARQVWNRFLHESLAWFLWLSMASVLAVFAYNRLRGRDVLRVDRRKVVYLALVLIVGAGLIVNFALKDHAHRVRPRDIAAFGGSRQFTSPSVVSDQCDRNCHSRPVMRPVPPLRLRSRGYSAARRSVLFAAVGFAGLVAFSRIAAGAHFLSDTMVSILVMLLTNNVLYHYLLSPEPGQERSPVADTR